MRYRSVYLPAVLALLLLGLAVAGVLLVRYEPRWYGQAELPPGPQRQQNSETFCTAFGGLLTDISSEPRWGASFSDEQINAYLEEGFVQSGLSARVLPEHISRPRVRIEADRIRLAFRYGRGAWSTVVSIDLRAWLAPREPNVMCLELEAFHVGALPLAVQSILERISEAGRQNGIDVSWYRNPETGKPVAVLRFQADQPKPTLELSALHLGQGVLTIQGKSNDFGPPVRVGPVLPEPPPAAPDPGPGPRPN